MEFGESDHHFLNVDDWMDPFDIDSDTSSVESDAILDMTSIDTTKYVGLSSINSMRCLPVSYEDYARSKRERLEIMNWNYRYFASHINKDFRRHSLSSLYDKRRSNMRQFLLKDVDSHKVIVSRWDCNWLCPHVAKNTLVSALLEVSAEYIRSDVTFCIDEVGIAPIEFQCKSSISSVSIVSNTPDVADSSQRVSSTKWVRRHKRKFAKFNENSVQGSDNAPTTLVIVDTRASSQTCSDSAQELQALETNFMDID